MQDEAGNELMLGASSTGVFVRHLSGQPTVYFRWNDILNMEHNKRLFGIVCSRSKETVQFQMVMHIVLSVWSLTCMHLTSDTENLQYCKSQVKFIVILKMKHRRVNK